ncbi:nucleotidyl transferase AbiEii/AbiGii toxin family protein [Selenomonas massiliensis]|uniref:nucleotidyl transferase AbiEii/AbiGii toxin family protein n=1 Tax=Selenomonas massiliensis TaxID=2058293 RepID=UPI000D10E0E2|nr:nucleotidyl transferase AbiEii/AbiGii toxin family protein [Selenomonas massiliensis]
MNDQSVKDRLKNLGRVKKKNFGELLIRYAIERFLYRLSISPHREHFILKGGALLYTLFEFSARVTKDLQRINAPINISFAEIMQELKAFLLPIHNSCIEQTPFHDQWDTTGWR